MIIPSRTKGLRCLSLSNEKLRFLVGYAILAPSGHNTQPWLFGLSQEALCLYADRPRALPAVDPEDRELTISGGAALGTLRIALHHFGYAGQVERFPTPQDPDLLARICLGSELQPSPFEAIPRRHTNRGIRVMAYPARLRPWPAHCTDL